MGTIAIPRLVIGGLASGAGKTTVVVGLAQALRAKGLKVAVFKCGPDYLDPTYHARASGAACHNLDAWMMGREGMLSTFASASRGADIALIEGMMGLFDGRSPTSNEGSTAELARWLEAPVMVVVDASGMARTIAAIGPGLASFDPEAPIAGVFANRVGSTGHLDLLKRATRGNVPILGGLPGRTDLAFPERHLGLRTAEENAIPSDRLAAWGALLAEYCNLDALIAIAERAPPLEAPEWPPPATVASRCRIGIARDSAFHFYYEDNLRRLESLGASLVPFSPLAESALPDVDGLLIGGGYPEAHAEALASNTALREAIRAFAARGGPIYAECGGLMYLADAIRTLDGRDHTMVGLVRGTAIMRERLQEIGYVEVETAASSILGRKGLIFRGHQFRHSTLEGAPTEDLAYRLRRPGGRMGQEGYATANVLASYVHAHWASNPLVAEGFVETCARSRAAR